MAATTRAAVLLLLAVVLLLAVLTTPAWAVSSALKVEKLSDLSNKAHSHTVPLNSKDFLLFTEAPRNYSIVVVLTATEPSQACDLCQRFAKQYEIVATSWHNLNKPGRLYLSTLEYRVGQDIFAKMKVTTAPQVWHFPPTEGKHAKPEYQRDPTKFEAYDMARGSEAEEFVRFVELIVGHEVPIKRPTDYTRFIVSVLVVASVLAVGRLLWDRYSEIIRNPLLWSILGMVFVLFFISGHAWNSIRNAPFSGGRETISSSFQGQFGVETRLVATLYGAAAFSFALLAVHVPKVSQPSTQRLLAYAYTFVFFIACSAIIYVFRIKYGPYPFRLLF